MTPVRIQLSRKKGWRMPPNTVKVSRPGPFGNPWIVGAPASVMIDGSRIEIGKVALTAAGAVARFREWVTGGFGQQEGGAFDHPLFGFVMVPVGLAGIHALLPSLRGKNLACWCPLGAPCHADVLIDLANRP